MSRVVIALSLLCAGSVVGNVLLFRQLKVRERTDAPHLASSQLPAQSAVPNVSALSAPRAANVSLEPPAPAAQTGDKCKRKMEDAMRRQLQDPKERESLKQQYILSLQAANMGTAARLHISEQTLKRILELQVEQDLSERAVSISGQRPARDAVVNPQIASEFGEAVASQWAEDQRESSGRAAVQGIASLFTDANAPLSEEQRRRLVSIYADEFEMQNAQNQDPDAQEIQRDRGNPRAMANWFEKQAARQQAFEQRVQADAASILTPVQLELLRKRSDLEVERFHNLIESMPKVDGKIPVPEFDC
jgi:hypothetical protein